MKGEDKKNIIRNLLLNNLKGERQKQLVESSEFEQKLSSQWMSPVDCSSETDSERIWASICKKTKETKISTQSLFYKWYSVAASILLIISFGGIASLLIKQSNPVPMYVVTTGIQNLEKIQLPDGTNVCLGPGSRLEYPAKFADNNRDIKLKGQAFFDVTKNPEKPFHVKMNDIKVEVLGTSFELFNYDDSEEMEAVLVNGKIKVEHKINSRLPQIKIMKPNDRIVLNKQTGKVELGIVDADKYTSWRSGVLSFENENLSMIIPRLERWYGRKIICDEALLNNYRFTFKVRDESLGLLLNIMQQSAPLEYKKLKNENYKLILKR